MQTTCKGGVFLFLYLFKVHFLDVNKAIGEETQEKFNSEHGDGQAKFVCCDVTSQEQLEGNLSAI